MFTGPGSTVSGKNATMVASRRPFTALVRRADEGTLSRLVGSTPKPSPPRYGRSFPQGRSQEGGTTSHQERNESSLKPATRGAVNQSPLVFLPSNSARETPLWPSLAGWVAGVEFLLLHFPSNATNALVQTDRSPLAPIQNRSDGRENCLQYTRVVRNA